MKHLLLLRTLLSLVVAFSPRAHAAVAAGTNHFDVLTLDQALDLAERLQPELAEARALVDAAAGRAKQAGLFPNPAAIARIESAPVSGRTTGEAEYLAGVSQPIPLGGRLTKARAVEQLERERRNLQLEARRRDLRKRIHGAFATALYQDNAFQTQRGIASDTEKLVTTSRARVEAGDALPEDLARAEMELARARVELRRAQALREQSIVALKAVIGDPGLSVETLGGNLEATFEIPTLEALAANLPSHPEAVAADAAIGVRRAQVDLAKAERIPEIRVEALYRRLEGTRENAFDVGLIIPIPLFDRNQGRLREARAEMAAAEARSRMTQNELATRLQEAYLQLNAALANSRVFKAEILSKADVVLAAAEARYAAGDISLSEILPVRRDWAAVQLSFLESLRDVMRAWGEAKSFGPLH